MKKKFFILTISLCALLLILSNYAQAQSTKEKPLTKEQIEAFRSAKTARISVEQSYRYARGVKLPFEYVAGRIFKNYAKLTLVGSDATDYDLNIKITASGRAVGSNYGLGPGTLYTGASVYGKISLEISGIPVYEKKFSGSISPPKKLKISYAKEQPNPKELVLNVPFQSRSQAPFKPALESGTYVSRMIEMIGEIWDPNCVQAALKDESWVVRKSAVEALGSFNDPRVVDALITALKNVSKVDVAAKAATALGRIKDPRAVDALIATLKNKKGFIAHNSADALGEIKDPRAIEPLIAALKNIWSGKNVSEALVKITGSGRFFGTDRKKWKKWWKQNKMKYIKNK